MPLMPATDETLTTAEARPEALAPASSSDRAARTIWNGPMVLTPNSRWKSSADRPSRLSCAHMLGGAGIVDQRIEPPPGRGRRDDLLAILVARDIALHHDHFGAGLAAEIGGLLRPPSGWRNN